MTKTKKKTKTLDSLTTALETIVKKLRGGAPKTKQMTLSDFVGFAVQQLEQAGKDEPGVAKRRLQALKRNVDGAVTALAKLNAEDTDSESIRVEVTTAFAPTGDPRMAELTTASDQSESEVSPTSLPQSSGGSFAENMADIGKALATLKAELEPAADGSKRKRTGKAASAGHDDKEGSGGGAAAARADRDEDGWPIDMASAGFLKGDKAASGEPAWGFDPGDVAGRGTRAP
jgi:hypothetical protein